MCSRSSGGTQTVNLAIAMTMGVGSGCPVTARHVLSGKGLRGNGQAHAPTHLWNSARSPARLRRSFAAEGGGMKGQFERVWRGGVWERMGVGVCEVPVFEGMPWQLAQLTDGRLPRAMCEGRRSCPYPCLAFTDYFPHTGRAILGAWEHGVSLLGTWPRAGAPLAWWCWPENSRPRRSDVVLMTFEFWRQGDTPTRATDKTAIACLFSTPCLGAVAAMHMPTSSAKSSKASLTSALESFAPHLACGEGLCSVE